VASYDAWVTSYHSQGTLTDWLVMCSTNNGRRAYVDGVNVATADRRGGSGNKHIGINYAPNGGCCDGEVSDWAVAEIITWNRALSDDEMLKVSDHLAKVGSARVTEVAAYGSRSNCAFSAVTGLNGEYEITLKDTSGTLPVTAKVLAGAYKEEVFPETRESLIDSSSARQSDASSQPAKVLLVLKSTSEDDSPTTTSSEELGSALNLADADQDAAISRLELQRFIESRAGFPNKGHAIVPESVWNQFDVDSDGILSAGEFTRLVDKLQRHVLVAQPILVYPIIDGKYLSNFEAKRTGGNLCVMFSLIRGNSTVLPSNSTTWNEYYAASVRDAFPSTCTDAMSPRVVGDVNMTKLLPLLSVAETITLDAAVNNARSEDDVYGRVAHSTGVSLFASQRYHDIVHIFDKSTRQSLSNKLPGNLFSDSADIAANELEIRHRGVAMKNFADETTVVVRGAILFPKQFTSGVTTCGLFDGTIQVSEIGSSGEPEEYKTDESGWFEISLTRGKSFMFNASFPKHTLCYTGRTIADAADVIDCADYSQTVTLSRIMDGTYIFFTDTTRGNIDLGLYQGQCEALYSGAVFKITPINGCHPPVLVTSEEVSGWMRNMENIPSEAFSEEEPIPINARAWPFAAMDYSVLLHSGPSVGGIGDLIANEPWKDGCATEDGDVVTFFRRRNALERLVLMREYNDWQQIRYKYHGYICVEIPQSIIPKITDDHETCYKGEENDGGLKKAHFIGTSSSGSNPLASEFANNQIVERIVKLKVFELHIMNGRRYARCYQALPNVQKRTGSTEVKIRQDVSGTNADCHPDKGGGEKCDFQAEMDSDGYLKFPGGASAYVVAPGEPNLAGNHRRTIRVEVERNDLFRSVTAVLVRELIPLGVKPRGGDGLSDDTFWATVPLDGLVYTVVHDPPGGNSYAELISGTDVKIEWALASTHALTVKAGNVIESTAGIKAKGKVGLNLGYTAEGSTDVANYEVSSGGFGEIAFDGPNVSVESESTSTWDLTITTDRAIRSSQDPALPGRAGDTILGGGIELVYKLSDILDLSVDVGQGQTCLGVQSVVTWLPRRPTTYLLSVHSIEAQILPNLEFLLATVQVPGGVSATDNSGKPPNQEWEVYLGGKVASWERTLAWASPADGSSVQVSLTGSESVFGSNLATKMKNNNGASYNELFDQRYSDIAGDLAQEWSSGFGMDVTQASPILTALYILAMTGRVFPLVPHVFFGQLGLFSAAQLQTPRVLASTGPYGTPASASTQPGRLPYSGGIVHPLAKDQTKMQPDYGAVIKDVNDVEVLSSFGMNDAASNDMDRWVGSDGETFIATSTNVGEGAQTLDPGDTTRILSSLTGSKGSIGMDNGANQNPPDEHILLSFSGGGQALDFTFSSNEALEEYVSHVTFKIDGEASMKGGYSSKAELTTAAGGPEFEFAAGLAYGWAREVSHDRVFMWNKYGHMSTTYSLGDPQYGDKFVVSIGADKRFGTPIFITQGGRSMCPGELGTVFRESGVSLEIPLKTKMNTANLNPGQRAIYEVVIKNESPYREASAFALRLVDGRQESLNAVVSAAYAAAAQQGATASTVIQEVTNVATSTIAKDSEDMQRVIASLDASSPNARSVAEAVYRAASTAPQESKEFGDSAFRINGNRMSIGDYMPFKFVGGDSLERQKFISQQYLNLAIEPGFSTRQIRYLQLRLQSLCETEIWEDVNLYRDPIAYTQNIEPMSWLQSCPKVQFDESTVARYLSSKQSPTSSGVLYLKVNNPDQYVLWPDANLTSSLMNEHLKYVRLQYRPVTGGEWITAKDPAATSMDKKFNLLCGDSRTEGCAFDWKINNQFEKLLSGFKDNVYELRLKTFCAGGPSLAEPSVHEFVGEQRLTLAVDTKQPMETGTISSREQFFGVVFDESVECSQQSVTIIKTRETCGSAGAAVNHRVSDEALAGTFVFKCTGDSSEGRWIVKFPPNESGRYEVTVDGIRDAAGNAAETVSITVDAHCHHASSSLGTSKLGRAPTSARASRARPLWASNALACFALVLLTLTAVAASVSRRRPRLDASTDASTALLALKKSYGSTV